MSQNENQNRSTFTGFIVHYEDGRKVREKENFFSQTLKKVCATNWTEINKELIIKIELYWNGEKKIDVTKEEFPNIKADDWYFSHRGCYDMSSRQIKILSRNIGYREKGLLNIFSVMEDTGEIRISTRADKK